MGQNEPEIICPNCAEPFYSDEVDQYLAEYESMTLIEKILTSGNTAADIDHDKLSKEELLKILREIKAAAKVT